MTGGPFGATSRTDRLEGSERWNDCRLGKNGHLALDIEYRVFMISLSASGTTDDHDISSVPNRPVRPALGTAGLT